MKLKIVIIAIMMLIPVSGFCIIDELEGQGGAVMDQDITDRPLRDDSNLKAIQTAFDKSDPRANVKRFPYDPNITYKIRLREFMGSTIVLPRGEKIAGYSLFDKNNFTFVPKSKDSAILANVFDVYGKYHGADTNLIVFGESGHIYSFYLRNDSVKSDFMPSLVTYIEDPTVFEKFKAAELIKEQRIAAKEKEIKQKEEKKDDDYLKSLPTKISPENLDFNYYAKSGDKKLKPARIFDDGYFTFFQYGDNLDKVENLPVIYKVIDGFDTPVNSRINGGTIIAETTGGKWTLRSGSAHLCIWKKNE